MGDMFITPIQPLIFGENGLTTQTVKGTEGIASFKSIFEDAINNVRGTSDELAKQQYLLATGQVDDPHTYTIAASKAQLSVDLLVAMRDKALTAYNEIMRINL